MANSFFGDLIRRAEFRHAKTRVCLRLEINRSLPYNFKTHGYRVNRDDPADSALIGTEFPNRAHRPVEQSLRATRNDTRSYFAIAIDIGKEEVDILAQTVFAKRENDRRSGTEPALTLVQQIRIQRP